MTEESIVIKTLQDSGGAKFEVDTSQMKDYIPGSALLEIYTFLRNESDNMSVRNWVGHHCSFYNRFTTKVVENIGDTLSYSPNPLEIKGKFVDRLHQFFKNEGVYSLFTTKVVENIGDTLSYSPNPLEIKGKFVDRLHQFFKNEGVYSLSRDTKDILSESDISKLGSIIGNNRIKRGNKFYFDITDTLTGWDLDAYGSSNSCFRVGGTYSSTPRHLENAGVSALRFYIRNNKKRYIPSGRVFFKRNFPEIGMVTFWNSYGLMLSRFMQLMNYPVKDTHNSTRIELLNQDRWDGRIWINMGVAYVLHPKEQIPDSVADLEIRVNGELGPGEIRCAYSDEIVHRDDATYVEDYGDVSDEYLEDVAEWSEIMDTWIMSSRSIWNDYYNSYVTYNYLQDDGWVRMDDNEWYHMEYTPDEIVAINALAYDSYGSHHDSSEKPMPRIVVKYILTANANNLLEKEELMYCSSKYYSKYAGWYTLNAQASVRLWKKSDMVQIGEKWYSNYAIHYHDEIVELRKEQEKLAKLEALSHLVDQLGTEDQDVDVLTRCPIEVFEKFLEMTDNVYDITEVFPFVLRQSIKHYRLTYREIGDKMHTYSKIVEFIPTN